MFRLPLFIRLIVLLVAMDLGCVAGPAYAANPHILQRPALSKDLIAFGYAGDLWTVPRAGGRAVRLTTGVGIETSPVFSPDGATIAFTGDYDGNTDVFTIPATGGVPFRVTYHPAADSVVGWSPDGKELLIRSDRSAASRYTQLFTVPAHGGIAKVLPLPMAYQGQFSADGQEIAYSPLPPAFGFNYTSFVSWGNYHGGRASTIWITTLRGLDSVEIPHETASDLLPVFVGGKIYFLSGRSGPITIFTYDPASKQVKEALHNDGPDIRTLAGGGEHAGLRSAGRDLISSTRRPARATWFRSRSMPTCRRCVRASRAWRDEIEHVTISPTGIRAAVEAHGDIFTVAAKHGPTRNITNTPGVMERAARLVAGWPIDRVLLR